MNKNLIPIPEHWRKHRVLCFVYWFFHWFFVNWIAFKHYKCLFPLHDIEKPFKLLIGVPYDRVCKEHLKKSHHPEGKHWREVNWIETVCDWEASAYSKPNSLLNARETGKKYWPQYMHIIEYTLNQGML